MKIKQAYRIIWLGIICMAISCMSVFNPIDLLKEAWATYFGDGTAYEIRRNYPSSTLQFLTATKNYTLEDLATDTSGGITTLNTLTATTQTFATGTTGTDFNVSSATSTHTLNIPSSSASNRGLLTSADWTTFSAKEPAIATGAVTTYWRGDKSFQALNQAAVDGLTTASTPTFTNLILSGLSQGGLIFPNVSSQLIQDATKLYWDDVNDRLGIGTITPTETLHIHTNSSLGSNIRLTNDTTGQVLDLDGTEIGIDDDEVAFFFNRENTGMYFGTNNTLRLQITNDANFGLNTSTQFGSGAGVIGLANATTASTSAPTGGLVLESIAGVLKVYQSDGTVVTVGSAGSVPGAVILLSASETQANSAVDAQLKTYSLSANSYSYIIMEAEGYILGAANDDFSWQIYGRNNAVQVGIAQQIRVDATGAGDIHTIPWSVKVSFTQTSAVTIDIYGDELTDGAVCYINSLRVYGVI